MCGLIGLQAQPWYDVCVLTMNTVTLSRLTQSRLTHCSLRNVDTQYRAVNDVGDCEATFDTACNEALKAQSEQAAYEVSPNATFFLRQAPITAG